MLVLANPPLLAMALLLPPINLALALLAIVEILAWVALLPVQQALPLVVTTTTGKQPCNTRLLGIIPPILVPLPMFKDFAPKAGVFPPVILAVTLPPFTLVLDHQPLVFGKVAIGRDLFLATVVRREA